MGLYLEGHKKFNTVLMQIRFTQRVDRETATIRSLLPFVLDNASENYPNKMEINKKLDKLFGAVFSVGTTKQGNVVDMQFTLKFVNPKLVMLGVYTFKDVYDFLYDIVFNPKLENGIFSSQIVEQQKNYLRDTLLSQKEDKQAFASLRANDHLYEGTKSEIRVDGYIEEIDSITPQMLYDYYKECLEFDELNLFIFGDVVYEDFSFVDLKFNTILAKTIYNKEFSTNLPAVIVENDDVNQAILHVYFDAKAYVNDDDYERAIVFNYLFGDSPTSHLFRIIREKHGLCYSIRSTYQPTSGLILVTLGIDPKDYDRVIELINEQIEEIINNPPDLLTIRQAIRAIRNRYNSLLDNQYHYLTRLVNREMFNLRHTREDFIKRLNRVKPEGIISIAKNLNHLLTYFLKGEENE